MLFVVTGLLISVAFSWLLNL